MPGRHPWSYWEAMVKYILLLLDTEAARSISEAENQAWYAEISAWYEKGRGSSVTDGPFIETKEALGGYSILETDTIDEAVEIAKTWPGVDRGWMTVEVRPVVEM